jgi:methionyl-tRNA formyltransferase
MMKGRASAMRIAFMGTPEFAVPALKALCEAGHDVVTVYSQPPRPAGRGNSLRRSPVQVVAEQLNLPVRTPARLRGNIQAQQEFAGLHLDAAVVAAYGLILPEAMLAAPARGCLNIHASLLPRWRGAAPIHAAILAGDSASGITIMQMDAGLDTGPMLLSRSVPITPAATTASLHEELSALGARLILDALAAPPVPIRQVDAEATYAPKLTRETGRIDWNKSADEVDRQVRAFDPWPGTFTTFAGNPLKILTVALAEGAGAPGTVLDSALTVACGSHAVRITRLQLASRAAMDTEPFMRGHAIPPGTVLGP